MKQDNLEAGANVRVGRAVTQSSALAIEVDNSGQI